MSQPTAPPLLADLITLAEQADLAGIPRATLEQLAGRLTRLAHRMRVELDTPQPTPDPTARLWKEWTR